MKETGVDNRFRRMGVVLLLVLLSMAAGCASRAKPFTIVALPDTQMYSQNHPDAFLAQTQWIKDHKDELNIVCVVTEGDITNDNSDTQWAAADRALTVLDGVVPWFPVQGNHDMPPGGQVRDATAFNKYVGVQRFQKYPWYGGHFESGNENAFYFLDVGQLRFLVVCLEFGPRDEAITWANHIIAEHKDRPTILVTHCYMNHDDTRVGPGDPHNPHSYPCNGNDGEDLWEKLVRKHSNVFLVLSGHISGDGTGRLTSLGDHNNPVHQVVANYQFRPNGGDGWLRIMTFHPQENRIEVRTYSPTLDQWDEDNENRFDLQYDMGTPRPAKSAKTRE